MATEFRIKDFEYMHNSTFEIEVSPACLVLYSSLFLLGFRVFQSVAVLIAPYFWQTRL